MSSIGMGPGLGDVSGASASQAIIEIDYPTEKLSRLMALVKGWLAIPSAIVWFISFYITMFFVFIGFFKILFSGELPRNTFDRVVKTTRWQLRIGSYWMLQTDVYPGFDGDEHPGEPVRLSVPVYNAKIDRWRSVGNYVLVIPAALLAGVYGLLAGIAVIAAWFAVVFTGRYPQGIFNLVSKALTLNAKVFLYTYWAITEYPI